MTGNTDRTVSTSGQLAIEYREGVRRRPYDHDGARNCTVGVGQLLHHGPCTAAERHQQLTDAQVQQGMAAEVTRFTEAVRDGVPTRRLTQNQFDALVSFAYNAPRPATNDVLNAAERGDDATVATVMQATVHVHKPGVHGRPGPAVVSQGLVNRRADEVAQYARPDSR